MGEAPASGLLSFQDLPPAPFVLPKALPPDFDQALQQIRQRADTVNANTLLQMRLTGIRVGELRDLSIHALEGSEAHGISLRVPIGKTNAERLIPLSPCAVSLVQKSVPPAVHEAARKFPGVSQNIWWSTNAADTSPSRAFPGSSGSSLHRSQPLSTPILIGFAIPTPPKWHASASLCPL